MAEVKPKPSLVSVIRSMPANFWTANFMEILERLAFFGVRAIAPLYLVASANENGLGLDYAAKGNIYAIWALLQCLIPMVSGGFTERYGYKKSLYVAFVLNIIGYLGMAQSLPIAERLMASGWSDAGYWVFLIAACCIGTGTAIFKPPCHGTVAKTTDEETSSIGWGIFYWVVNIGGALAPMAAASVRGEINWHYVFYGAAIVTACNFIPAIFFFREPSKDRDGSAAGEGGAGQGGDAAGEEEQKGPVAVFVSSVLTVFQDLRLVAFLLIFSCFWLMFLQLWDLMPNFIDEWVDTSDVAGIFSAVSNSWVLESGQTKPEMIINLNPLAIIIFVIPLSKLVGKVHKVLAMIIGMIISMVGFVAAGATSLGWFCCVMILVFTVGEMTCSPTFSAYVGLIAPPDKKALYMGYSNIPFAIGWALGNKLGGNLYEAIASKFKLARAYLTDQLGFSEAFAQNTDMLPNDQVMQTMAHVMKGGDSTAVQARVQQLWGEVSWDALPKDQIAGKVSEIYTSAIGSVDPAAVQEATRLLWDLHQPYMVWYYLGVIGLAGTVGMIVFYIMTRKAGAQDQQRA